MQKLASSKHMQDRLKRMICLAIYRGTKSWSKRLWRIVFVFFLVLALAGSLWHLWAGLFIQGKPGGMPQIRGEISVLPQRYPDSTSLVIPFDSLVRGKNHPRKIER